MSKYDFDLLVIGGGSGGVRMARWSAGLGARTAIAEGKGFGGTCVLRGCIPKKLMIYGSRLTSDIKTAGYYGWEVLQPKLNWTMQKKARDKELRRLENIYENLLEKKKVIPLKGMARLIAPHKVTVNKKHYTAKYIVLAVGGQPFMPNIKGIENALSSDDVFKLESLPKKILIMGSGYIGLEFAGIFKGLGSEVTVVSRRNLVLKGFDQELRDFLQKEILKTAVKIITEESVTAIKKEGVLKVQGQKGFLGEYSEVLFAAGRTPMTENLGLEALGIKTNSKKEIKVNKFFETSAKDIYALGDCADTPFQLTPTATAEAVKLSEYLFKNSKKTMDYDYVPTAVFSDPPLTVVGLTEEEARKKNSKIEVYKSCFRPLKYTTTDSDKKTFMKMIVCAETHRVLGAGMVGEDSPEIMQGIAVALKAGAKKEDFDNTIGIHPTSAEEFVTMREKSSD